MNTRRILAGATFALMLGTVGATRADAAIMVVEGFAGGSGDVSNVVFNSCSGNDAGPGLTIQGCFNGEPMTYVNLTSDVEILGTTAGGQARIETVGGGGYSYLEIWLDPIATFSKLQLNINTDADGFVTFFGEPGGTSTEFAVSASGNNQFTITGEDFTKVILNTTVDIIADVRQVRLGGFEGGPDPDPVPEPTTLALFGLGLLGAGVARRRR